MEPPAPPRPAAAPTAQAGARTGAGARLLAQALRFGVVGASGVVVDTAMLYLALWLGAGLYGGRVFSYLMAASWNWALNRAWTFRAATPGAPGQGGAGRAAARQWALFLLVNLGGFALNYGCYALLVGSWPRAAAQPAIAVAAGALAGLGWNFLASRAWVFRAGQAPGG